MKYLALLGALLFTVACGSSDHPTIIDDGSSGKPGAAGHTGSSGGGGGDLGTGGDAGEAGVGGGVKGNPLAPVVEITSPEAVSDPNNGTVITGSSVLVTCSTSQSTAAGSQPVLGASVKIQMFGADGKQLGKDGAVMSTTNAGEYGASFVLTSVPSGVVSFECSASDSSAAINTTTAKISTFYDAGPTIAVTDPADKSAHPIGAVQFKFSALPNSLATVDAGATVTDVTLKVDGVQITDFTPVTGKAGFYQASVDLNNPIKFPSTPVGSVSVVITAKNTRGTTSTSNTTFVVDSTGPLIAIVSPSTTGVQFVTGQVLLVFKVVDEAGGSGVNPDTVTVQVNTGAAPVPYKEGNSWHSADGITFNYAFNVKDTVADTQVSVIINAVDNAGNKALGTSAQYYVDTEPPIIDLDPPQLQEMDSTTKRCGEPFDPLGDAPNDLATISSDNYFRALVWDTGNHVDTTNGIVFFSDIDTTAGVRIYFQEDSTKPLVTSDVPNGVCNKIADLTLPFSSMVPITPAGASFYDALAPTPGSCVKGTETLAPKPLCTSTVLPNMTRVIQHEVADTTTVGVIYGTSPVTTSLCAGASTALTTKVTKDGWVCAAVVAQDKLGNVSVSAPVRYCLDADSYQGTPPCAGSSPPPPPSCFSGCTPPGHFEKKVILKP